MTKLPILLALLACAGCAKPSDISESRREHILAGPHGWIDITVRAPTPPASAASAAIAARRAGKPHDKLPTNCELEVLVDGETMVRESAELAQADAAGNPMGWRFPVPAGALKSELDIASCVEGNLHAALPLTQAKDQLSLLEFDGASLVLKATQAYAPATLDTVHGAVGGLRDRAEATDGSLTTLTRLVGASLVLNLVVLAVHFLRRR